MSTDLTPTITDDEVAALPLADARADLLRELVNDTGAATELPRRTRRWMVPAVAAAAIVALAVPVGLSQLGGDAGGRGVDPGGPTGAPADFQIREVKVSSLTIQPGDVAQVQLDEFTCPARPTPAPPDELQVACDGDGTKYLLEPAAVDGGVLSATSEIPQGQVSWVVTLQLDDPATAALADLSRELVGTETQVALVVDGEVLSAPTFVGVIETGQLQISGGGELTEQDAAELAGRLVP